MKGRNTFFVILITAAVVGGCRKAYLPSLAPDGNSLLVVEGVINPGNDSTFIKLSHTVKLSEKTSSKPEPGATVSVEGEGTVYTLKDMSDGTYASAGLNLNVAKKYHLKIHTANGGNYQSDDVEVKVTPPIDSLTYKIEADGVHIYSATHDATNNTRYYRWDYQETWRYNSMYESKYKVEKHDVVPRVYPQDEVYKCYGSYQGSTVLLGSSAKLSQDVITQNPVTQILRGAERTSIRYTIKLNQYALTKEAYAFWENLKKNTEQLGGIFDALASEIGGNIHNTANPNIPVIGFVSISTIPSQRIYIDRIKLPFNSEWKNSYPYDCGADYGLFIDPRAKGLNTVLSAIIESINYPLDAITVRDPLNGKEEIIGYGFSSRSCVDCTIRGTIQKPSFWTDN